MIIRQDKCIFCQIIFTKRIWVSPEGIKPLVPNDDDQGVMLSPFCCLELGYGV